MKKSIILLFVLLIIPAVSAVQITLSKDSYSLQETLQAEITGNFISLNLENILIYEQTTPRSQPVISDLTKQGDIYYFYAILPNKQGNFSLKIENARYTDSGIEKTTSIVKEFKIAETNTSSIQINPGFVKTSNDFTIKLKSLIGNNQITTQLGAETKNYSLIEGVEKQIDFSISPLEFGRNNLKIASSGVSYTIPVFIIEKTVVNHTLVNWTNQTNINQTVNISDLNQTEIEEYINYLGNETESLSCYDIGNICLDNQKCSGETIPSLEGSCCIGDCVEQKKSNTGTIIGIILLVLIIGFVGFVYWRSKKKQRPKSTDEILKDKEKQFQRRMRDESSEVVGRLGKI